MKYSAYELATYAFDPLHAFWENEKTQRAVAGVLIACFIVSLLGIELGRQGLLPDFLATKVPHSHYAAVGIAFTLVLVLEVVSLIFVLPCSFAKSVGKQFEILCLILMRNSFKELINFPEPITFTGNMTPIYQILSDGAGAFAVFVLLGIYYRIQKPLPSLKPDFKFRYVASKKMVALLLLCMFAGLGVWDLLRMLQGQPTFDFFATFYTILIFSDILLVLISQRFLPSFHAVFRNSGFALVTLLIRLALAAPPFYNAALGVASAGFAVLLTLAYNSFYRTKDKT
ncbi:hypothetical protein [Maridesulfovibrio hydrothermalis]|uniref:Uncharacterized protein n=1 Tax=Maridesulfovibrio hydrothermalis AM13 = DSM 14728 TaxID=1121451 RepID=L0R791_9BACT|nr:hypothetical protein [Maridesulfovibrio hydrothermalis]CCO22609.1 conserved membrane protein of unknown function [Maridesulfovibrio hydrothermalis AM13 = DSM 14728]